MLGGKQKRHTSIRNDNQSSVHLSKMLDPELGATRDVGWKCHGVVPHLGIYLGMYQTGHHGLCGWGGYCSGLWGWMPDCTGCQRLWGADPLVPPTIVSMALQMLWPKSHILPRLRGLYDPRSKPNCIWKGTSVSMLITCVVAFFYFTVAYRRLDFRGLVVYLALILIM
jgi:hypothetical protein